MSRYCAGSTIPGCGRQSRDVGAHGKIESNGATGELGGQNERSRGSRFPLDRQIEDVQGVEGGPVPAAVVLGADDRDGRIFRRQARAVEVGRQKAVADQGELARNVPVDEEMHGPRFRVSGDHPVLFQRVDADSIAAQSPKSREVST